MRFAVVATLLALISVVSVAQQTWSVPSQFSTIQAAVNAAQSGDTIIVAPGTYFENVDFGPKHLVLRGAGGAAVTTIDGSMTGTVVRLSGGSSQASELEGFTIRNGNSQSGLGGGVNCAGGNVTIRGCRIRQNSSREGGGIRAAPSSNLSVIDCVIEMNVSFGSDPLNGSIGRGGGVFVAESLSSSVSLQNCVIQDNIADEAGSAYFNCSAVTIIDCIVRSNSVIIGVSAIRAIAYSTFVMARTAVTSNHLLFGSQNSANLGEPILALDIVGSGGTATVEQCEIRDNEGMGLRLAGSLGSSVVGSVVANNGGGLQLASTFTAIVVNGCTVADNKNSGGISCGAACQIMNSVVFGNTPSDIQSTLGGMVSIGNLHNNLIGNALIPINGNISGDPLFVDRLLNDYHISSQSPCIDVGNSSVTLPSTDIDGSARIVGPGVDIGADEFPSQVLPGSSEDLDLFVTVNGKGDPVATSYAVTAGDIVKVRISTTAGSFVGGEPLLVGRLYFNGFPPTPVPGFPELHISSYNAILLYGSTNSSGFSQFALQPQGVTLFGQIPAGLDGLVERLQCLCLSPNAQNGYFAASAARDLVIN